MTFWWRNQSKANSSDVGRRTPLLDRESPEKAKAEGKSGLKGTSNYVARFRTAKAEAAKRKKVETEEKARLNALEWARREIYESSPPRMLAEERQSRAEDRVWTWGSWAIGKEAFNKENSLLKRVSAGVLGATIGALRVAASPLYIVIFVMTDGEGFRDFGTNAAEMYFNSDEWAYGKIYRHRRKSASEAVSQLVRTLKADSKGKRPTVSEPVRAQLEEVSKLLDGDNGKKLSLRHSTPRMRKLVKSVQVDDQSNSEVPKAISQLTDKLFQIVNEPELSDEDKLKRLFEITGQAKYAKRSLNWIIQNCKVLANSGTKDDALLALARSLRNFEMYAYTDCEFEKQQFQELRDSILSEHRFESDDFVRVNEAYQSKQTIEDAIEDWLKPPQNSEPAPNP